MPSFTHASPMPSFMTLTVKRCGLSQIGSAIPSSCPVRGLPVSRGRARTYRLDEASAACPMGDAAARWGTGRRRQATAGWGDTRAPPLPDHLPPASWHFVMTLADPTFTGFTGGFLLPVLAGVL